MLGIVGIEPIADLGIILATAAIASMILQRLRQPAVIGYLIAGVLLGPHVFKGVALDIELTHSLSELGVILLMFSVGLEFRIRKLMKVGISGGVTAAIEVGLMISLGFLAGQLFGWSATESLFVGGCLAISSTMLVSRAFSEQRLRGGFVDVVYAVLIFEDLLAILLLVVLTAVASGRGLGPTELAITMGRLAAFLGALLAVGLLVVPRFVAWIARAGREETLLIAAVAICFAMSALANAAGYSVALGAFLAGMLVAESGESHAVERVIAPLRDIFAAIFFISIGTLLDPGLIATHWLPVVVLSAMVLIGKVLGVSFGSFLAGNGLRRSVRAGMSLAQIGEFSFIIAALGASMGATGDFLLPVAVAVSCVTALTTPAMIRRSEAVALRIDHLLPRPVQVATSFYEAWIEQIREQPPDRGQWAEIRRELVMLAVDSGFLVLVIASFRSIQIWLIEHVAIQMGMKQVHLEWWHLGLTIALALVFATGVVRRAHRLGGDVAGLVLPKAGEGGLDLGSAPRRAFTQILELAIALALGLPLVAILQPFLPVSSGVIALALIVLGLVLALWRSLSSFEGHVRAGTELVLEVLARQSREGQGGGHGEGGGASQTMRADVSLASATALLPGFPDMVPVTLTAESAAIGRTLAELNLRAVTGATVMAISRSEQGAVIPSASEVMRVGDVLTLAGSHAACATAAALLVGGAAAAVEAEEAASTPR
jgi:CPA2 family monovalent cation:H+ antiporter-2